MIEKNCGPLKSSELVSGLLPKLLVIISIGLLSMNAFSKKVANEIKDKAGGYCQECGNKVGKKNLIAAHIDHTKNDCYDDPENGRALCLGCETAYHARHIGNAKFIGLTEAQNGSVVNGRVKMLRKNDPERADFISEEYL